MRNPKRIKNILSKLEKIWEKYPDQRLYQLMINQGLLPDSQLWHIEDNEIEEHLDKILKEMEKTK